MLPPQKIFSWIIQSLQHHLQSDSTCMPFSDKVSKKVLLLGEKGGRGKTASFSVQHSIQGRALWCIVGFVCVLSHSVVSDSLWPHGLYPRGSSGHGTFQARILQWVAISYSRGSSQLKDWTCISCVSCTGRGIFHLASQKLVCKIRC